MKTLVGLLLTVGLAVGYNQADATCKSKQMTHKTKIKSEKLAMHRSTHSKLETRCVCHAVTHKSGMISAKSYGGFKKTDNTLNGGSPLMNGINLNIDTINYNPGQMSPSDTMRLREDQMNNDLNRNDNGKDFDKPIINNGWENSGLDYQNK